MHLAAAQGRSTEENPEGIPLLRWGRSPLLSFVGPMLYAPHVVKGRNYPGHAVARVGAASASLNGGFSRPSGKKIFPKKIFTRCEKFTTPEGGCHLFFVGPTPPRHT